MYKLISDIFLALLWALAIPAFMWLGTAAGF